jgi:molybdopterin converting factor small subunit
MVMGVPELTLELPDGTDISTVLNILEHRKPELRKLRNMTMIALNRSYADMNTILKDGDELAVFPPVGGG